jgi:hypothetical protein
VVRPVGDFEVISQFEERRNFSAKCLSIIYKSSNEEIREKIIEILEDTCSLNKTPYDSN